jgi:hypothetical protein
MSSHVSSNFLEKIDFLNQSIRDEMLDFEREMEYFLTHHGNEHVLEESSVSSRCEHYIKSIQADISEMMRRSIQRITSAIHENEGRLVEHYERKSELLSGEYEEVLIELKKVQSESAKLCDDLETEKRLIQSTLSLTVYRKIIEDLRAQVKEADLRRITLRNFRMSSKKTEDDMNNISLAIELLKKSHTERGSLHTHGSF